MCGIAGLVGGFVAGLVNRMNALQRHRGPDREGVFQDAAEEVALGHVRLAILGLTDLAAQPMDSQDGRYVLVFNGEIYDFQELRTELADLGHSFRSSGDTEVLLHGLQQFGPIYVKRLNGIFAFALRDRQKRELLLARDHLGVKPLYFTAATPGTLLFASELKVLCAYPGLPWESDFDVLQQHLAYCHACDEHTALKGIRWLPPGAFLECHNSSVLDSNLLAAGVLCCEGFGSWPRRGGGARNHSRGYHTPDGWCPTCRSAPSSAAAWTAV